jgi:eukaryotic-like serine/threonine-protein kinase
MPGDAGGSVSGGDRRRPPTALLPWGITLDRLDATDPRRVGPYTLLGRLGAGGMGAVYLGRSSGGRTVAVKVVRPELAGDAAFRDRFRAEVSAATAVSGAFTAPVVDADPEARLPWMATAFVAGVPLSQAIATRGPLPETSLWMVAAGIAEALAGIHRAKLIHRDLKPGNVLLAPDGPHVIDFGITRAMDGAAPLTATGSVVGSPGYMSPEQVLGQATGPESDMFSLGATLVYAATARSAYGEGPPHALLFRVASGEADPETLAAVPASLRDAVTACLDRDPARRPTPRQLADYVDRLTPTSVGGSWLPPALTADIVAAGAVVTGDSVTSGTDGTASGTGAMNPAVTASTADVIGTVPYNAASTEVRSGADVVGGGPGGGPGDGPSRRSLLLAAGGAVAVVGAGVGIAAEAGGGTAKPKPPTPTPTLMTTPMPTPMPTNPTGPDPNPSASPTGPATSGSPATTLPPAAGATGTMAGPDAKPAWTATPAQAATALAVSGRTLVSLGDQSVAGYDAATGKGTWAKPVPIHDGSMKVAGATVYAVGDLVTDSGGTLGLFAVDAATGAVAWNAPITAARWQPSSLSGVLDGVVFVEGVSVGTSPSTSWLWAVDGKTHKELWRQEGSGAKAVGSVYVPAAGGEIYVGTVTDKDADTGQIQVYDATTGTKGWTLGVKDEAGFLADSTSFAMGSGNLIYAADQVYGIDPATNKQNWAWAPAGTDSSLGWPGISADGSLVVFVGESTVYAVDTKTGQQKWKTATPDQSPGLKGIENGMPQIADGNVYVLDSANTLWALDVATGATRWKYSFPVDVAWIAAGGHVYAAYGTALVAIKAAGQ